MNNVFTSKGRASRRSMVAAALTTAWLSACGGGGSVGTDGPGSPAIPGAPPQPAAVCNAGQLAAGWTGAPCPEGMICLADVAGDAVANVTPLTAGNRPDWSPDGRQVVFQRIEGTGRAGIYVIDAAGGGEVRLATGHQPAWSPDGRRIAFANESGIAVMNEDGSGQAALIGNDFSRLGVTGLTDPSWSPDGQRIAFVQLTDWMVWPDEVYVVSVDGSDPRRLTSTDGQQAGETDPAWSPDGGRIAVIGLSGLAIVDAAGGDAELVYRSDSLSKPDWFPDGSMIAFAEASPCGPEEIRTVAANGGGNSRPLVFGAHMPAWSPDGGRIAFASALAAFSPVSAPASVYDREGLDSFGHRSRYVLYDDGTFGLQYATFRGHSFTYSGHYGISGSTVGFTFDDSNTAGPWTAKGTLDGTRLSVEYNVVMVLADFEDGVYVLSAAVP